jgi:putative tryptophan/tyrosine transport system substrate-binding protein
MSRSMLKSSIPSSRWHGSSVTKTLAVIIGSIALLWATAAQAGAVVVVLTSNATPYTRAEQGFRSSLNDPNTTIRTVLLSDLQAKGMEAAIGANPDAVIAIGTGAATYLHAQLPTSTRLVYCMVTNPAQAGLTDEKPANGISIDVPITEQFSLIAEADPNVKTLGMLYRSSAPDSKQQLDRIQQALPSGWKLETVAVEDFPSVADAINALTSRPIDAIWTNLDSGIYESATVRTLLLAGLRTNLPVFGFSPAFVRAGALVGIGIDPTAQGQQAADLTARILKSPSDKSIPRLEAPDSFDIAVNLIVADKLGLQLPPDLIGRAKYVFKQEN